MARRGTPEEYFEETAPAYINQEGEPIIRYASSPRIQQAENGGDTSKLVVLGIVAICFLGLLAYLARGRK